MKRTKLVTYLILPALVTGFAALWLWPGGGSLDVVIRLAGGLGEIKGPAFSFQEGYVYRLNFERASWSADLQPKILVEVYRVGEESGPISTLVVTLERQSLAYGGLYERLVVPPLPSLPAGSYYLKVKSENVFNWEIIIDRARQQKL